MEIEKTLNETPSLIAKANEEAEELRFKWQHEKETYGNKEAKFMLLRKSENPTLKTTDLKILVANDDELFHTRLKLIMMESDYRKKEKEIEALDDYFTSSKMQARLKIAEKTTQI